MVSFGAYRAVYYPRSRFCDIIKEKTNWNVHFENRTKKDAVLYKMIMISTAFSASVRGAERANLVCHFVVPSLSMVLKQLNRHFLTIKSDWAVLKHSVSPWPQFGHRKFLLVPTIDTVLHLWPTHYVMLYWKRHIPSSFMWCSTYGVCYI